MPSLPVANLNAKNMITRPSRTSLTIVDHSGATSSPTERAFARLRNSSHTMPSTATMPRIRVGVFTIFVPLARMRFGPTCGM